MNNYYLQKILQITLGVLCIILLYGFALARALTPYAAHEARPALELLANRKLGHPVTIASAAWRWHGFSPVLDLRQIDVFENNPRTDKKPLWHIDRLELGIDAAHSLWARQWRLRTLVVNGMAISAREGADGSWTLPGLQPMTFGDNDSGLSPMAVVNQLMQKMLAPKTLAQLYQWHKIVFENITLQVYLHSGQIWQVHLPLVSWRQLYFSHYQWHVNASVLAPIKSHADMTAEVFSAATGSTVRVQAEISRTDFAPLGLDHFNGIFTGTLKARWENGQKGQWVFARLHGILSNWRMMWHSAPFILRNAGVNLRWQRENNAGLWTMSGRIQNAHWDRFQDVPGVRNLAGYLTVTPAGGSFLLKSHDLKADFGSLFLQPLWLDSLTGQIDWQSDVNGSWRVTGTDIAAKNADIQTHGHVNVLWQPQKSPVLNIAAYYYLSPKIAAHLKNYLPQTVLHPDLIHWLTQSIQTVAHGEGTLRLEGPLNQFPYTDSPGEFLVDAELQGVKLHYDPSWPAAENLNGELIFAGNSMEMRVASADMNNISLSDIDARIPVLGEASILKLDGNIFSDAASATAFIQRTPLKNTLGQHLVGLDWAGPLALNLHLQIPLAPKAVPQTTQIQGLLEFKHNVLRLPAWQTDLQNLTGQVQFTQSNLTGSQLQADLFKSPVILAIKSPNIAIQGQVTLANLPPMIYGEWLKSWLTGTMRYQAVLRLPDANARAGTKTAEKKLTIVSSLQGVNIGLPAPFGKKPEERRDFRLEITMIPAKPLDYLINYERWQMHLMPRTGTLADGWDMLVYYPQTLDGRISWPPYREGQAVSAKFRYVHYTLSAIGGLTSVANGNPSSVFNHPEKLPPLQLLIDDLQYNHKKFGQVNMITVPEARGTGVEIRTLTSRVQGCVIEASGQWQRDNTLLHGNLHSGDIATMLKNWGVAPTIAGNNGHATFALQWPHALYAPSFESLRGNIHVEVDRGSILTSGSQARQDIGRLLTILSFQSLKRRLQFDFSDLTNTGLSFDNITGDFQLGNGEAVTNNLVLNGPVAQITLTGRIDLVGERYNLRLQVVPHLTSSLPLVATIAGGPLAGAAAWAANRLISPVINRMAADNYTITGSWDKPVVTAL